MTRDEKNQNKSDDESTNENDDEIEHGKSIRNFARLGKESLRFTKTGLESPSREIV